MADPNPCLTWWQDAIASRDKARARALAARLSRADLIEVLAEPEVYQLGSILKLLDDPLCLARIAQVLASVRHESPLSFARAAGKVLSPSRFERLLRARDDELVVQIRRALPMIDRSCDPVRLARDIQRWNDQTRVRWVMDFHGGRLDPEPAVGEANSFTEIQS